MCAHTRRFERRRLDGGVLIVGGDSGVADLHCTKVSPIESVTQYLFATREAPQINFWKDVAKPDVCAPAMSTVAELVPLRETLDDKSRTPFPGYSSLSALTGFTLAARRAGRYAATQLITSTPASAPA